MIFKIGSFYNGVRICLKIHSTQTNLDSFANTNWNKIGQMTQPNEAFSGPTRFDDKSESITGILLLFYFYFYLRERLKHASWTKCDHCSWILICKCEWVLCLVDCISYEIWCDCVLYLVELIASHLKCNVIVCYVW